MSRHLRHHISFTILTFLVLSCGSVAKVGDNNSKQHGEAVEEYVDFTPKDDRDILIICTGDSFTEGMGMTGAGYANYGENPYPAQLYKMLVDAGYKRVTVVNQGQGGETVPTMAARTGGVECYIRSAFHFPADDKRILINSTDDCKFVIAFDNVKDNKYGVVFTDAKPVTNPIVIDDQQYIMTVEHDEKWTKHYNYIQRTEGNTTTFIPQGAIIKTNSPKKPDISILYGGLNGSNELSFEKWASLMDACLSTSGGKGIVMGSTHRIWESWLDIEGENREEKYQSYKRKAVARFGQRFLDLYELFFNYATGYCLDAGFFENKNEEELNQIRELMSNHIVPKEFSYDGAHQGDVHLNREGYYVVSKLVFDRLIALGYL